MPDIDYILAEDRSSITCGSCRLISRSAVDIYYRRCPYCRVMLGPEIRQRWSGPFAFRQLRDLCNTYGDYKRVVSLCGEEYAVPTEWIITQGIQGSGLSIFPRWGSLDHAKVPRAPTDTSGMDKS